MMEKSDDDSMKESNGYSERNARKEKKGEWRFIRTEGQEGQRL